MKQYVGYCTGIKVLWGEIDRLSEKTLVLDLLIHDASHQSQPARLRFNAVRDLKLQIEDGQVLWVLTIRDVSRDQLERIKYRVVEEENDAISFYCSEYIETSESVREP